jgi:hypothetical protein
MDEETRQAFAGLVRWAYVGVSERMFSMKEGYGFVVNNAKTVARAIGWSEWEPDEYVQDIIGGEGNDST